MAQGLAVVWAWRVGCGLAGKRVGWAIVGVFGDGVWARNALVIPDVIPMRETLGRENV